MADIRFGLQMTDKSLAKLDQAGALSVRDLIAEWLQYEASRGASPATLTTNKKSMEVFRELIGCWPTSCRILRS